MGGICTGPDWAYQENSMRRTRTEFHPIRLSSLTPTGGVAVRRSRAGFSLVESLTELSITAILWRVGGPAYAIDDETAIAVDGDRVTVVSEGHWKRLA